MHLGDEGNAKTRRLVFKTAGRFAKLDFHFDFARLGIANQTHLIGKKSYSEDLQERIGYAL